MKVYQMKGEGGIHYFNFHAKDQADADAKAADWVRVFQGLNVYRNEVAAVLAPDQTVGTRDEWLPATA